MSTTNFSFPTAIRFGAGARKQVAETLLAAGCKRPLIVTDKALGALPVLAEFKTHLAGLDVAVFSGVFGNPTCSQVMDGAAAYKAHKADCVIGFGGGAALDVAKVVGIAATHEGDILEYVWDHPKVRPIVNELPYFVALPTTSGTGSEVGRSSVVSENDTHLKRVVFSPKILAKVVFADPELTLAVGPEDGVGAQGVDPVTHLQMDLDQRALGTFAEGVQLRRVLCELERPDRLAGTQAPKRRLLESPKAQQAHLLLLQEHPVVVPAGQKLATVQK
jgi:alcohol dehydrogenase class IV